MSRPASITVSEALVNYLASENIKALFGLTGEGLGGFDRAVSPLVDAGAIDYIPMWSEFSMPHALHSYYRASCGMVGAAVVTQGMGLTQMDNGLRELYVDAVPAIIINGQVPNIMRRQRTGPYNSLNYLLDIASPFVKAVFSPRSAEEALRCIPHLLNAAKEGIPGPVILELPSDIAQQEVSFADLRRTEDFLRVAAEKHRVKEFVDIMLYSQKPLFIFGEILRGDDEAAKLALELVELANGAYLNSFRQFDVVPENERFGGVISITNSDHVKNALATSDIFVIGHHISQELTDNFTSYENARNIKFHVYPQNVRVYPYASVTPEITCLDAFAAHPQIRCDIREFLQAAITEIKQRGLDTAEPCAEWVGKLRQEQIAHSKTLKDDGLFPSALNRLADMAYSDNNAHNIVIGDSGNYHHQLNIISHRHNGFCATPRRTMGYSSGAIGAFWGLRHKDWHGTILATQGDGSYIMTKHQLNQAMVEDPGNINIATCVFDNDGYENVHKFHGGRVNNRITRKGLGREDIPAAVKAGFPDMETRTIKDISHLDMVLSRRRHQFLYFDGREK